ncbi:hypothetical protein M422DRAFT_783813 [Sphaerobolus stellatus SS14]|uniref:Mitochondrial import inner membrane translocase subunit TIM22 n=1 Tax=Sphaerobolus stellatus (strain SS14) TaxID=990650 RepID=A0A0C9TMQ6_SPHS4|nr:hypothetical protein M422DRAFT_783813 [Sphaerobolus stellatus SS14]
MPPQFTAPLYPPGKEPLPPGFTEDDRAMMLQQQKWSKWAQTAMESCAGKTTMAAGMGFGIGAFFSLMSTSFAYEDPLLRPQIAGQTTVQKSAEIFKDMGRGMYRSGKGFGKVGGLFAGFECVIESYRGRNDIYNAISAGFVTGGVLAHGQGPRAALFSGMGFAAFSAAIDLFLRREPSDDE